MHKVIVNSGVLKFGPGSVLGLNEVQSRLRMHNLEKAGAGVYRAVKPVEFKAGEEIAVPLADLSRAQRDMVVIIDPVPEVHDCDDPTPHVIIDKPIARPKRR